MRYIWTWWQSVTYSWTGWTWQLFGAKPRWTNPPADYIRESRRLDKTMVAGESKQVVWPIEYRGIDLKLGVRQKPWQGSVGGKPVQLGSMAMGRNIKVQNIYGGDRYINGELYKTYKPGESYYVTVAGPVRYGWAVEGYPNGNNTGDRHEYLIEADGTTHEMIAFYTNDWSCVHYRKYDAVGNMIDGIPDGKGATNKGNVQWTSLAWDDGDPPHRLGIVFKALGDWDTGKKSDSPYPYNTWDTPRYGALYRLSASEYDRQLALGPDENQRNFLDSLRYYGLVPYDQGGSSWGASIGMIAGSQQAGSSVADLQIPIEALEEVVTEG